MQLLFFPNVVQEEAINMAATDKRLQETIESTVETTVSQRFSGLAGQVKGLIIAISILSPVILAGGIFIINEMFNQGKELATVKQEAKDIATNLRDIKQIMFSQRLSQAASDPKNPSNIKEATNILSSAKQQKLYIDPRIIKETGDKFVSEITKEPATWEAAKQYLSYRSFLNARFAPPVANLKPLPSGEKRIDGKQGVVSKNLYISSFGNTNYEKSARFEPLNKPGKIGEGPELMVIRGDWDSEIMLDGQYMKNIVVKNLRIIYHGGPAHLQNVVFVNCTFDFQPGIKSQDLGKAILASASTTFESAS